MLQHPDYNTELIQGTYQEFKFTITGYTDETFTTVNDGSEAFSAGRPIYLAIEPEAETYKPLEFQYSIKQCVIREYPLGSTSKMVTLFHHDKHDCGNPFVDLQLTWVDHQFRIRHRAFVFTGH